MRLNTRRSVVGGILALMVAGGATVGGVAIAGGGDDEPLTGDIYDCAVAAALDFAGPGTVTETETGDDGAAYEVKILREDGRQVEVNLNADCEVIGSEPDDDGPGGEDDDDDGDDD